MSNDHEWLNLVEVSGPFLAVPVLRDVFPQGLEALPSGRPQRLRRTYEEWRDAVDMDDLDLPALHAAWIDDVLITALEMDETVLRKGASLPERLTVSMPEHGVTVAPDLAVVNPTKSDGPFLLMHVYEPDTDLDTTRRFDGLAITPADRMVALLRATGCPTGIVTNGERWMLVHAPVGAVVGFASWYARLWGQEPETLRAFVSLVGVRRFFGPDEGKLPALYERSLKHQDDVTEALGKQVQRAVEVLVQALDRADQDRNRELMRDVDPRKLYEAGLTVMMRLVFLLAAEERGLLLLGDPRYDSFYAISSLRMQLRADSEEILERRRSAWSRFLALFRGVYGGIDHPTLRLPALGGSLFDPDRYPFLEGRKKETNWRTDPAEPLPIDDRTVLLLLEAIQTFEGRTLSYRALDVEQIGHVYEGLLERTVKRVDDVTLELDSAAKAKSPRVTLGEMESARLDGAARVSELLKERSERSESAIRNALERAADDRLAARLLTVCRGDIGLRDRILPYAPLLRTDPWGYPLLHHKGAFVVVLGADRRESGTHYTPKSLTEKIVEETLAPVAYRGPAEGKAPEEWELKHAEELLDLKICDPAMGSGAFLVQACRWLSDRLVEAWSVTEADGKRIDSEGRIVEDATTEGFDPLSQDAEERAIVARRLVAERCLYGVDKNPLAVELAKLSLWLTTMSKGRPFGFLDHNLRSGDSLFGIHDLDQLIELDMNPQGKAQMRLFGRTIRSAVDRAQKLRQRLREIPIRDIHDIEAMAMLDSQSRGELELPTWIADAFMGITLTEGRSGEQSTQTEALAALSDAAARDEISAKDRLLRDAKIALAKDSADGTARRPFHWPLEFPEVFLSINQGFDALVGNPPFMGGRLVARNLGVQYQEYLKYIRRFVVGGPDLCVYFFLRAFSLLNEKGTFGLIGTKSIAETGSRTVGLDQLIANKGVIYRADARLPWPGNAAVVVSIIWICKSRWQGPALLNSVNVNMINGSLAEEREVKSPIKLKSLKGRFSQGQNLHGQFDMDKSELEQLIQQDESVRGVLSPLYNGQDLNTMPTLIPTRWAINFRDMTEQEARKFRPAFTRAENLVKPFRQSLTGQIHQHCFWKYWDIRPRLLEEFYCHEEVLATAMVTKYVSFRKVSTSNVYTHKTIILFMYDWWEFACLQSSLHQEWAFLTCGTLGASTLSYSTSSALETWPMPKIEDDTDLKTIGASYYAFRDKLLQAESIGLTQIYNRFHSPTFNTADIDELRNLHREMDLAVLLAYGWQDIELDHDFHEVTYLPDQDRVRFTISEHARFEVLRRLADLNHQRYQEEVDQGLHRKTPKSGKARGRKSRAASASEPTLDLDDILPTTIEGDD